jgi:hypothetical protein
MPWFRVDDKLPDNRKARRLRKSHPEKRRDVGPFGLWVLAGAWSTDGFVPTEILEDWDDDADEMAARLVASGLWHPASRDGEPGYIFHDWDDQNPVKYDSDPSVSGTFGNHVRWHEKRGKNEPDCEHCNPPASGANRGDIGAMPSGIGGESLPSRPDPTRPEPNPDQKPSRATRSEPDRFDEFWSTYDKKHGRKVAAAKYRLALKKPGITDDLLISAAASYIAWQRQEGKHPQFTKDPATWLNGEHWNDERVARAGQPRTRVQEHLALVQQLVAEEADQPTLPQIGYQR